MGQELGLSLRGSLGSAGSQGQVLTGVPGAAGLRWALRNLHTEVQYLYRIFTHWYSRAPACSRSTAAYPQVFPFDVSLVFKIKISLVPKTFLAGSAGPSVGKIWVFQRASPGVPAQSRLGEHPSLPGTHYVEGGWHGGLAGVLKSHFIA